jgi:hypothetical protein
VTATVPLPSTKMVAGLLSGIVGRAVTAGKAAPLDLRSKAPRIYGTYRDPSTQMPCLAVCDMSFCGYVGGAMLVFPLSSVKDVIRTGTLEDGMLDCVREILNICARIFNDNCHQVFQDLYTSPAQLPQDAAALLKSAEGRVDMEVEVAGYGSGQMTILIGKAQN